MPQLCDAFGFLSCVVEAIDLNRPRAVQVNRPTLYEVIGAS
jgi:hypothetical protein